MIAQTAIGAGRGFLHIAGAAALRPAGEMVTFTLRLERRVRWRASQRLAEALLSVVDAALRSPWADEVVQHALDSGLAERALARTLSSDLTESVARDVLRYEVVERIAAEVLDEDTLERLLTSALERPATERLVARIVESRVVDEAVGRLADEAALRMPRSPAFWALIDQVATSPAVTEAISEQGRSFGDQVAADVRERSRTADARLERAAWRLFRRGTPAPGGAT